MSADTPSNIVQHMTTLTFEAALGCITATLNGMTIFAKIDHAAGACNVGMTLPPTTVLFYGNPKGGTPIMLAAPPAALDLPLRVLVRANDQGKATVALHPARPMLQGAGVPEALASRLGPAERLILEASSS